MVIKGIFYEKYYLGKKPEGMYPEHFYGRHKDAKPYSKLQIYSFRIFDGRLSGYVLLLNKKEYKFSTLEEAKDFCENYIKETI